MSKYKFGNKQARAVIADEIRRMIMQNYLVEDTDEDTLYMRYQGFYLQICFTDQHPLMRFQFIRNISETESKRACVKLNALNLKSVLGTHTISDAGCYAYRTVHWLEEKMFPVRFFEILQRCADEAARGYSYLCNK